LNRLFQPLKTKLSPDAHGLDFGCGQEPTLSVLFEEAGYGCDNYDLHFANDPAVLEKQYDFLTCSETMEHFCRPLEEFERFLRLMKPGGWIGIMTQLRDEAPPFEKWFYKDDATHVCFFSRRSFQWLEKTYGLRAEFHPDGVVLFQMPAK
jgi:cyclopropane fatty-acyl-phospholipid synthase-like methyltransferase